jgi:hypothetical protein
VAKLEDDGNLVVAKPVSALVSVISGAHEDKALNLTSAGFVHAEHGCNILIEGQKENQGSRRPRTNRDNSLPGTFERPVYYLPS